MTALRIALIAWTSFQLAGASELFTTKVQPLLTSRCISCHGVEQAKAGLRLDSREALLRGGVSGPAAVPGAPEESLVLQAVLHAKPDLEMPPKERLTPADIQLLRHWILEGLPWPEQPEAATVPTPHSSFGIGDAWSDPRNPIARLFNGQRLDLWSLRPIAVSRPPTLGKIRHPLDRFVIKALAEKGLALAPPADRRTLARRVSFDLTGLPPSPSMVESFISDRRAGAYERLVEQLLTSTQYGEHWARLWLDTVRYSDSNGFDWDEFRPSAWRFRDYVVRSFNEDKAFDRFVREQLAGDEMLAGPPRSAEEQDLLIATGYLRLGPQDNSAPLFNEQDRARTEYMADLVETTGSAFLGMTLACCRCHDHKYDPMSQADHFRIRAFFEPLVYADNLALDLAEEQKLIALQNATLDRWIAPLRERRDSLLEGVRDELRRKKQTARLKQGPESGVNESESRAESAAEKVEVSDKEVEAALSEGQKTEKTRLEEEIRRFEDQRPAWTRGLLATDSTNEPPVTRVLFQGDHRAPREAVAPGFFSILDPNPARISRPVNPQTTGRRLALANWIVSTSNPLTARVLVNRVWQSYFGEGLVATPNDFGLAGARPSQPELLDWLAKRFMQDGWSLKSLHRLIVTSATYAQSARPGARDSVPGIHRNLRRLTAEQLRDALLSTGGALTLTSGGAPVWPALPPEILQANPAFLDDNAEKTKGWYPSEDRRQSVRSLYLIQKRTVMVPFLEAFDLPGNNLSCPRRSVSTVAPQALTLLNSPLAIGAARSFAERISRSAGDNRPSQVQEAFRIAFQRAPSLEEAAACGQFLERRSLVELCRVLLNANEFAYVD